jgi:quinol monooxygenase YgiN
MLVVAGAITFDPEHHQAVADAAIAAGMASRAEEGCVSYEFFADLSQPGRLLVFEEWDEERHLLAHFKTSHFAEFHAVLAASGPTSRDVNRYYVSKREPNRTS